MGDSFHPGALPLTDRLMALMGLTSNHRVLDLAAGRGTSALHIAERIGCQVTGIDLSQANIDAARLAAAARGLEAKVTFLRADGEDLPFEDGAFDAVLCECAFCLFPDKSRASREVARVLAPNGALGMSDLVVEGALTDGLMDLAAWVACVADARPLHAYIDHLAAAGLTVRHSERHDGALVETADRLRDRLFVAELLCGVGKLSWSGFDFRRANALAREARAAISGGGLGYALIAATRTR